MFFAALSLARATAASMDARVRYTSEAMADCAEEGLMLATSFDELERALDRRLPGADEELDESLSSIVRRARDLRQDLRFLLRADDESFVFYLEHRGLGTFLRASPVDVSRIVRSALFDRFRTVVLTSATLAVDGRFDYIKGRLGIGEADELQVASEFDYAQQALLYLPRRMPPPKAPAFAEAVARETIALLTRSRGRAARPRDRVGSAMVSRNGLSEGRRFRRRHSTRQIQQRLLRKIEFRRHLKFIGLADAESCLDVVEATVDRQRCQRQHHGAEQSNNALRTMRDTSTGDARRKVPRPRCSR